MKGKKKRQHRQGLRWWMLCGLALLFLWGGSQSLALQSCVISPANPECRPCPKDGDCGSSFVCVKGVCRPEGKEPVVCEFLPDIEFPSEEPAIDAGD